MRRLQTFDVGQNAQLALTKAFLESNEIPCISRNEHMLAAGGGVPYTECYPELWIMNDEDFEPASRMLREWRASVVSDADDWECASCGEGCESQFALCWSCGTPRQS
jgi:Putative prokaryotic signal transducing protein